MGARTMAYYPGCSLHSTARELDESFRATAAALGLQLQEIPGWVCCGNTAVHSSNRLLAAALPVSELAKVEQLMGLTSVAVPCAACFSRFMAGAHAMQDQEAAADIAAVVGHPYEGTVTIRNLVDVYYDEIGLEVLKARVDPAVRRAQGRLLLRLPAGPTAEGHPRRGPGVPDTHGRCRRDPGVRAGPVELQDRLLRRQLGSL